jgi:hypothetical protein
MNDESGVLKRIEKQLEILIRLVALRISPEGAPMIDRAARLQKAGLQPKDIATLCDSTPNAVSVALTKAKRQGKKTKTKK